jgi:ornithine carbamoyltransferase
VTARHLLDIDDLAPSELLEVLEFAERPDLPRVLENQGVAMLFEKPSARTRNSTEMAVFTLGGHGIYIEGHEVGIDRRESAEDVARTLACYHRILCARVFDHHVLIRMAKALDTAGREVPVVNLLSDQAHPCQAIADLLTLREVLGAPGPTDLQGRVLSYVGDGNNMCRSLAKAAVAMGMEFRIAAPEGYRLSDTEVETIAQGSQAGGSIQQSGDPQAVAKGADALYTDVWTSMGQEEEAQKRFAAFAGFGIDDELVSLASPEVVVMHCLPAHRGEEITASVVDGPHSVVWRQVAHRMTAMRGVFAWLVGEG